MLRMFDNPLTIGPDPNSKEVGRAQGIHGSPSMSELALFFNFNFVFIDGPYNGSTVSVMGRVAESQEYRELSIIGGSGVFRLAKGVATAKTYFSNDTLVIVDSNPRKDKKGKADNLMGTRKLRATLSAKVTADDHNSALALPLGLMFCRGKGRESRNCEAANRSHHALLWEQKQENGL
ncbi:Dirigent protein 1 [Capsicum annuum]|nr:Dirigent protein 1 [Capsicum annuum]